MFESKRYMTCGVQAEIPFELQLFMWALIDEMSEPKDYFQIFRLTVNNGKQHVYHESERPEYQAEYDIDIANPVTSKIYVIDDETHSTMLLAEEY